MDFNEEVKKATDKFVEEKLPKLIEDKVTKMTDDILDGIFRSYSDIGKQIKEKIEKQLDINLQQFDMTDYNALVGKAINDRLIQVVNESAIKPIMSLVNETVGFLEMKKIKLSAIHDMVKDASMEENEDEREGEFSFYAVKDDKYKWITVSFDLEKDVPQQECGIEFLISYDRETIFSFKSKSYWSKKGEITPAKLTQLSSLEHKIFRLYSAQVKIEIDETDFEYENQWSRYD